MKDLARRAKCSVNTVSLALRDSPRISTGTRDRIQTLARQTGYRPNPLISALVSTRRRAAEQTIALLTKFREPFQVRRNGGFFENELYRGIEEKAVELGFRVEEFPTAVAGAPSAERLTGILRARGIRGVLLFPSGDIEVGFPALDWQHFAVVAAGFHANQWPVHRTALDQGRSVEMCLTRLTELGFRRIGFAISLTLDPRWNYAASGRFLVWQATQPKRNLVPWVPCKEEFPSEEAFEAWVLKHRPEAVIVIGTGYADGLEKINAKHGLDVVPVLITGTTREDLAGAPARPDLLGRTSISVLARELYLNHYGVPAAPEVTLVSSQWRDGARLGRLAKTVKQADAKSERKRVVAAKSR
jgi:DNA-binding LacI/PurR family transcriptional regulator